MLQFRLIKTRNEYGDESSGVKPFLIDLDSTNGSFVNGVEIPASRYYELKASDGASSLQRSQSSQLAKLAFLLLVLKFGQSSREYVLLHEEAA